VKFCEVFWAGPGLYAGLTQSKECFVVFKVADRESARFQRAVVLGVFDSLSAVVKYLRRCGGYKVTGRDFLPVRFFSQKSQKS
jgi:hypothetical protein